MHDIRRLPTSVVNKIAAGEVIERPASVVKELVENALDAGATRIDVAVEKGGGELLRVSDNGRGIAPEQLPLAVEAHATSKIRDADDLFRVGTLGFRGEALASIAEISRFLIRSRALGSDAGAELEIVGGRPASDPQSRDPAGDDPDQRQESPPTVDQRRDLPPAEFVVPCGCPPGTIVEVRSLFFNTPVRRKFLKTTQTEMGHISEAITRLALAHPQVHFTLRHNGRAVHDLPPMDDWKDRIARFFGQELAEALIPIERTEPEARLFGYVANPSHSRPNNRAQYLFLNGRYIRDRSLQHALSEAYRGLLLSGRYPIAFLCFEAPTDSIDVNVHPTKLEVRFEDSGRMYSLLLATLRTKFLSTDLTARWKPGDKPPDRPVADHSNASTAAHDAGRAEQVRREIVDWAKGQLDEREDISGASQQKAGGSRSGEGAWDNSEAPSTGPLTLSRLNRDWELPLRSRGGEAVETVRSVDGQRQDSQTPGSKEWKEEPESEWRAGQASGRIPSALQVHNRYLISESDEGVLVIDQHALHERILYEQLREKVLAGALESQNLLVPETIDLAPAEAATVLDQKDVLAQLGMKVEPFGGDTVLVSSYPAMLANVNVAEMLRAIVDQLLSEGKPPDRRDVLDDLLHMMSCKAAVKAGDRLTPEEIEALLQQRHLAQDTHHCPHGRPTALVLTREDLDRQFMRT